MEIIYSICPDCGAEYLATDESGKEYLRCNYCVIDDMQKETRERFQATLRSK